MVVLLDLGRIFTGIGLGVTLSVPMVYLVEIVHPSMVSTLGVVPNLFAQFGILVTYALGISLEWYQLALICKFEEKNHFNRTDDKRLLQMFQFPSAASLSG